MKKNLKTIIPVVAASLSLFISASANAFADQAICGNIGFAIGSDTNRADIVPTTAMLDVLKTRGPIFLPLGETLEVSANASALTDSYGNPGKSEYAWYVAEDNYVPIFKGGFNSSPNFQYKPTYRGTSWVALVMINSNFTDNLAGLWDNFIPVCQTVEVISHEPPSLNPTVSSSGGTIRGSANAKIDTFSKRGREGKGPLVTWNVRAIQRPGLQYNFEGQELNFSPEYSGLYTVVVIVNDGEHLKSRLFTEINVTQGIDPCANTPVCNVVP